MAPNVFGYHLALFILCHAYAAIQKCVSILAVEASLIIADYRILMS
jgi:hypothetical protein